MQKTKPKTSGYVCIGGTCGRSDLGADEVFYCADCRDLICINCIQHKHNDEFAWVLCVDCFQKEQKSI